jgi:hypothetical protein
VVDQRDEVESINRQVGLEETNRGVVPLMLEMIDALDRIVEADLPFRIEERRARVLRLRDMMDQAEVTASEKYRRVMEAYQGELEFGRTTEAYSAALQSTGQTVDFLRVGRTLLVYQTSDGSTTGWFNPTTRAFEELPDRYRLDVRDGLAIARNEKAPDLVMLPVPGPEERNEPAESCRRCPPPRRHRRAEPDELARLVRPPQRGPDQPGTGSPLRRERDNQRQLLAEACQELAGENARSDKLRDEYDQNERVLAELETTLAERMGNLGELFGVVRQSAGDVQASLDDSMVTAQMPGRTAFLSDLAQRRELPTVPSCGSCGRQWLPRSRNPAKCEIHRPRRAYRWRNGGQSGRAGGRFQHGLRRRVPGLGHGQESRETHRTCAPTRPPLRRHGRIPAADGTRRGRPDVGRLHARTDSARRGADEDAIGAGA